MGLLGEMFDELAEPFPGCLFASYVYQSQQFDDEIMCFCSDAMKEWRALLSGKISQAVSRHSPGKDVDADALADLWTCIFEGALLLSKTMNDPKLVAPQFEHYRRHLQLLFAEQ